MISGTYVPIVIMPHDITGITIYKALKNKDCATTCLVV